MTAQAPVPVDAWIRIEVGREQLVAFTFRDPVAGISARGDVLREGAEAVRELVEHPTRTVRLRRSAFTWTPLDESELAALGLPKRPPWAAPGETAEATPWRQDPDLVGHDTYPDDIQVRFFWADEQRREDMWVRLEGIDADLQTQRPAYRGRLLNESLVRPEYRTDTRLSVVSLPGGGAMAVLPILLENLERWRCACQVCGFDLFPLPLASIVRAQFQPAGDIDMTAFTTRCPACNGTMLVERRSAGGAESTE